METGLILGIDLCDDYSQICYYDYKEKNVESVGLSIRESKYQIPTAVCKQKGGDEWYAGDDGVKCRLLEKGIYVDRLLSKVRQGAPVEVEELTVMPFELLTIFLKYLVKAAEVRCQKKDIQKIYVTVENFTKDIIDTIKKSFKELGIETDKVKVLNHQESYIYYSMSQPRELWNSDVALFDYTEDGLAYYRMYTANIKKQKVVMVEKNDMQEQFTYDMAEKEETDERLLEKVKQLFNKKVINTVYVTGSGFKKADWAKQTLNYICSKRRVFAGQNLFAKGACYAAVEDINGSFVNEYMLACRDRITTRVEIDASDNADEEGRYILVKEGCNWTDAEVNMDFILTDEMCIRLYITPVDTMISREEVIELEGFPKRPPKTTRINLRIHFDSDNKMLIQIRDKGFGEFFRASNKIVSSEIIL